MAVSDTAPQEARRYALLLDWGTRVGLLLLSVSFFAYVSGLVDPHVPLEHLPHLWILPVDEYLQATASPLGWGWLGKIHLGDYSNLLGIALLASCSIPPLLAVLLLFRQQQAPAYAIISAAVVLVLLLAASGWLSAGH